MIINFQSNAHFLKDLLDHRRRVAGYLHKAASELVRRAIVHDDSKFSDEEYPLYELAFPEFKQCAYGTAEYKTVLKKVKPAIQHHYQENDHHPEHFSTGIYGMNLIQLQEMVYDWIAASERSQANIFEGLEINRRRFGIDDQLYQIIRNTIIATCGEELKTDPNTLYPEVLLSGEKPT